MMIEHPPPIMVTLDMMMPMSQSVENIGLMEVGQLGPAIRFVCWFILPSVLQLLSK